MSPPPRVLARPPVPARPPDERCDVFASDPKRVAAVRARLVPGHVAGALAETFRVLGDPTRVRILDAIADGELCVCDIATLVALSESAVSHQLGMLRHMRLVRARRQGRMVFYALDDQHILDLFAQGLRHVEEGAGPAHAPGRTRRTTAVSGFRAAGAVRRRRR